MRFLFAAATALSLSACFGAPGEPLSATRGEDGPAREARSSRDVLAPRFTGFAFAQQQPAEQPPEVQPGEDGFREQALAELALTTEYASVQAYAAVDAGLTRDHATAVAAAVELATAAALVSQRAQEVQALSTAGGEEECGCGGCATEPGAPAGEVEPGVEDAANFTALAAEFGGEIADGLDPPSTTVCTGGCEGTCTDVPGTVDEAVLAQAIEGALDAADGCAAAGETLGAL